MKKGNLEQLQQFVAQKIKECGFDDETLQERLLLLTEEFGEVIKACRGYGIGNVKGTERKRDVGEELVDLLNMLLAVAIKLDIDLEEYFWPKWEKVCRREYKRKKGPSKS